MTESITSLTSFWNILTNQNAEQIKNIASEHIGLALLICFLSGILTSLTPCVYPMIPITINIFGRAAQRKNTPGAFNKHTFFLSSIYVAGMCFTYSVMGLIAGMTGSLFGKILQSSWMLAFLTLLFLTLAISQLGFFKLALPASLQTKLSRFGDAQSKFGIFLMGLFSGLIVSPCVGPVIAGILAFVFDSSNALKGFLYFLSFSLGLGVLFLLIGGFSGLISKLPKSGKWMNRINRLLASLMFFATAYYGYLWIQKVGLLPIQNQSSKAESLIHWNRNEEEALKLAKEKNLPLFVDFTALWCEACHVIEKTLFQDKELTQMINEKFIPLQYDVTDQNDSNEMILKKYGVLSLPTFVFRDSQGTVLESPRIHGVVSKDEFLKNLNSVH